MALTLREVVGLLDGWYDPSWAESWDAVGLVTGDPDQPVGKVLLAVDPAPAVVQQELVTIPACGHLPMFEREADYVGRVLDFLRK